MAYVALYRKFRPRRFEELVGQDAIVRTLLNQIETGRIAHAYLFTGPRGTGKTSMAKLFARAINCQSPENGNPCGKCEACLSLSKDESMDIIEIDAASNNGVDNIRDIRDKVAFAPACGKYKVYIIDEVHMLSPGAFNALLKTLEEPPKHVVFILATTEIHKLPATILSRCQRYDFKLISLDVIASRLETVLKESEVEFSKEAIELIARTAEGGMRDALSLADVCVSYCGNKVSLEDAMRVLGISDRKFMFEFTDALIDSDTKNAISLVRNAIGSGKDAGVLALETMTHLRDVMLARICPENDGTAGRTKDFCEKIAVQAQRADESRLLRAIEILSHLESEIKLLSRPEIQLELAAARICMPECEDGIDALADRVSVLENKIKELLSGKTEIKVASGEKEEQKPKEVKKEEPKQAEEKPAEAKSEPKSQPKTEVKTVTADKSDKSDKTWQELLKKINEKDRPLGIMIRNFSGRTDGNTFTVFIPESAQTKEALIKRNEKKIEEFLSEICSRPMHLETVIGTEQKEENEMMKAAMDLFS